MSISLESIETGVDIKAPKIVAYGVGGIGKTTFAAGAPDPVFIFTEDGQGSLDVSKFPLCKSWEDVLGCVSALYTEDHAYKTVVIDSMDFAEPLLWQYTARMHSKDDIEAFGFGKGYGHAVDMARQLFDGLDALRNDKGMAIVILAHCHTIKFEDPELSSYDTYDLRLHKRLADHVDYWSDAVLFANFTAHVVEDDEGFNRTRKRAVGVGKRVLYTERRPTFRAKNRYGLPPQIDLSWSAFAESIAVPTNSETEASEA